MIRVCTAHPMEKMIMRGVFDNEQKAIIALRQLYPFMKKSGCNWQNMDRNTGEITIIEILPYVIGTIV